MNATILVPPDERQHEALPSLDTDPHWQHIETLLRQGVAVHGSFADAEPPSRSS